MTTYPPPIEDLPIFDSIVFSTGDEFITQNKADKRYLRYPVAQGKETLQAIDVNGLATFNDNVNMEEPLTMTGSAANRQINNTYYNLNDVNDNTPSGSISAANNVWTYNNSINNGTQQFGTKNNSGVTSYPLVLSSANIDLTSTNTQTFVTGNSVTQYTSSNTSMNKPLIMNGSSTDRTIQTTFINLQDQTTNVVDGSIYANNNIFIYDNNINSGSHEIYVNSSSGNQRTMATFQASGNQIRANRDDSGTNPMLRVVELVTAKNISMYPAASTVGLYNPIVQVNDDIVYANNQSNIINTENLTLTTNSTTNSGVRITPTTSLIGSGGTTAGTEPTTRVKCDGTNVLISPNIKFPDNTVQNSSFTGAGTFAGSYTSSNITLDANGKITAISNGTTPSNITANSYTVTPNPNPAAINTTGIFNQYNAGSTYGLWSGSTQLYPNSLYTPLNPLTIRFNNTTGTGTGVGSWNGAIKFRLNCFFYLTDNSGYYGQCSCDLYIFDKATTTAWGSYGNTIYNINNKINGNGNFYYVDATYAPNGRQYWTTNQQFSGLNGLNYAYLAGFQDSGGQYRIQIYFQFPYPCLFEYDIQCQSSNQPNLNNIGISIYS